jgi:hypothetical protein
MEDELIEEKVKVSGVIWDKPHYLLGGKPFFPTIYEPCHTHDAVPPEFNAVKITLDGRVKSSLDWRESQADAERFLNQGLKLFFDLNLGLFNSLHFSLSNQTQFQSLALSLEHFRDSFWKMFREDTLGLSLYRGTCDFSQGFPWEEATLANWIGWLQDRFESIHILNTETGSEFERFEAIDPRLEHQPQVQQLIRLFCRDAAAEYLGLLADRLPDALPVFSMLDASAIVEPVHLAQLTTAERFDRLELAVRKADFPSSFVWQEGHPVSGFLGHKFIEIPRRDVKVGVYLPSMDMVRPSHYQGLNQALKELISRQIPFKFVSESYLITEWDGLDYLIYVPSGLNSQGKRKLQGFCAAGGHAVSVGFLLGLLYEVDFPTFLGSYCQ